MPFIIKLLLLLLVALPVYLLRGVLFQKYGRSWFFVLVGAHALFITLLAITVLNTPSAILSDEVTLMNHRDYYQSDARKEKAYEFVKNNLVLINTSFDKEQLPNPAETEGDSTYINITNRSKLIRLLRLLNNDSSNVDAVVCDIGFTDTTNYDTLLYNEMLKLYQKNKLIVSAAGGDNQNSVFAFPNHITGDVKEETNEKLFLSHRLWRGKYYSLPYQVYVSLHQVKSSTPHLFDCFLKETFRDGKSKWVMNTFLPQFFITDESLLQNNLTEIKADEPLNNNDIDSAVYSSQLMRNLGAAIKDDGEDLLDDLNQRKLNKQKNIVFIGTFSGDEDVHKTAYAELHGPVILLNLIYALEADQDALSFLFLFSLFVLYSVVTFFLFNGILIKMRENGKDIYPFIPTRKRLQKIEHREKKENGFLKAAALFGEFIFLEESHYIILLIVVLITESAFGILINGISLVFYLIAFETFAVHFGKSYLSSRDSLHHT